MPDSAAITDQFEHHRRHLRAVAYRMLGSSGDAEDAVQEAWLRIREHDPASVDDMRAWLTTVVARICLNLLRARRARREELAAHVPDPVVVRDGTNPEQEELLAESVGFALMAVLDTMTPAERVAFVLHDVFGIPFADIASALDRSVAAVQQLASRARRRVRNSPKPDRDLGRQRRVVDAFFAASRDGDFDALLQVLDPGVRLRIDGGTVLAGESLVLRGAGAVAAHTATYRALAPYVARALVNGAAGALVEPHGTVSSVMAFTIVGGRITRIDALVDPERLAMLALG